MIIISFIKDHTVIYIYKANLLILILIFHFGYTYKYLPKGSRKKKVPPLMAGPLRPYPPPPPSLMAIGTIFPFFLVLK